LAQILPPDLWQTNPGEIPDDQVLALSSNLRMRRARAWLGQTALPLRSAVALVAQSTAEKRAMSHRQTRMERADEGSFPIGRVERGEVTLARTFAFTRSFAEATACLYPGMGLPWQHEWYQVFRFARPKDADRFIKESGGERVHPSEKGNGKNWAQWRKGTHRPWRFAG
jgi:hypothetical protein